MPSATEIEALLASGDHHAAARALAEDGQLEAAQALFEKVWDFAAALALARRRGDRVGALRLALEARDLDGAGAAIAALREAREGDELRAAAEVLARRRRFREAAELTELGGEPAAARELFVRAGLPLEAARLDEAMGRLREAGILCEQALSATPPLEPGEAARARLVLGRVLGLLGRHEEAARALQRALASGQLGGEGDGEARRLLVISLAALGLRDGAAAVLEEARRTRPELGRLDAFLAQAERERGGGDLLSGRYRVLRLLGAGAIARVYLARDRVTDEEVAVKLVPPPIEPRAREAWRRFLREARAVSSIAHPNVVAAREVNEAEGLLVMEYQAGGTLEARAETGRPGLGMGPTSEARRILLEVIAGLAAAHARGVLHRDVKPANIFFSATGQARLGDFGAAHLADLGATRTAGFVGTLAYMSPEQITAAPLTFACDLYALGVTAFQLTTGRLPFEGPDFVGQHLGEPPPLPSSRAPSSASAPAVWTAWDGLVTRLLAKDPAARFGSLDELRRSLEALPLLDDRALAVEAASGTGAASTLDAPPGPPNPPVPQARDAAGARYRVEAPLARTAISTLHHAIDERLARPVILERFADGALSGEAGAARVARLKALARAGGPHLQRVLHLDEREGLAVYEAVAGVPADARATSSPETAREQARRLVLDVLRALAPLHRAGLAHGAVARAVRLHDWGATLVIEGTAAVVAGAEATARADLDGLRALLSARGAAPELPPVAPSLDEEVAALVRWATGAP